MYPQAGLAIRYNSLGTTGVPGMRTQAMGWVNGSHQLLMHGGRGYGTNWRTDSRGFLADLWSLELCASEDPKDCDPPSWRWLSGSSKHEGVGRYNTPKAFASANWPAPRAAAVAFTQLAAVCVYGGEGHDWSGMDAVMNDVWCAAHAGAITSGETVPAPTTVTVPDATRCLPRLKPLIPVVGEPLRLVFDKHTCPEAYSNNTIHVMVLSESLEMFAHVHPEEFTLEPEASAVLVLEQPGRYNFLINYHEPDDAQMDIEHSIVVNVAESSVASTIDANSDSDEDSDEDLAASEYFDAPELFIKFVFALLYCCCIIIIIVGNHSY